VIGSLAATLHLQPFIVAERQAKIANFVVFFAPVCTQGANCELRDKNSSGTIFPAQDMSSLEPGPECVARFAFFPDGTWAKRCWFSSNF
jgi:hypothetical protein